MRWGERISFPPFLHFITSTWIWLRDIHSHKPAHKTPGLKECSANKTHFMLTCQWMCQNIWYGLDVELCRGWWKASKSLLTGKTLCVFMPHDITYFAKYACTSPAASFSHLQAKIYELAETPLFNSACKSMWALVFIAILAMYCNCL